MLKNTKLKAIDKKVLEKWDRRNFNVKFEIDTKVPGNFVLDFIINNSDVIITNYLFDTYYCRLIKNPGYHGIHSYAVLLVKKFVTTNGWTDGFDWDENIERCIYSVSKEKYDEFNARMLEIFKKDCNEKIEYIFTIGELLLDIYNYVVNKCYIETECNIEGIFEENCEDLSFEVVG